MSSKEFTIILPTTGNRGALLPYSVGSIQNQTIGDFELFIIGDGVTDETRDIIGKLQDEDSRIRFFDHPKNERRGEIYRHRALQEAKGRNVCYLCDRDLMLPNHLETMQQLLKYYNFASTTFINVRENQKLNIWQYIGYFGPASEAKEVKTKAGISLSNACHTLDLYHKLPFGWRTTPKEHYTDIYMWTQFLGHPECNAYSHTEPTVLYFKRGNHPGASVEDREKELVVWSKKITSTTDIARLKEEALMGFFRVCKDFETKYKDLKIKNKSFILIKGHKLKDVPQVIIQKVSSYLKKF